MQTLVRIPQQLPSYVFSSPLVTLSRYLDTQARLLDGTGLGCIKLILSNELVPQNHASLVCCALGVVAATTSVCCGMRNVRSGLALLDNDRYAGHVSDSQLLNTKNSETVVNAGFRVVLATHLDSARHVPKWLLTSKTVSSGMCSLPHRRSIFSPVCQNVFLTITLRRL
jgi:hypothetical protein